MKYTASICAFLTHALLVRHSSITGMYQGLHSGYFTLATVLVLPRHPILPERAVHFQGGECSVKCRT